MAAGFGDPDCLVLASDVGEVIAVAELKGHAVYSTAVSNTTQSRSAMTISTGRGYFISFLTIFFHLVRWLWPQLCLENIGK